MGLHKTLVKEMGVIVPEAEQRTQVSRLTSRLYPNFLVIGAQKSASTFLQACIAQHPDVFMLPGESTAFESPDYEQGSLQDLEHVFLGKRQAILAMKRPSYLAKSDVAQRIRKHLPDAKLLVVLRNPIERAVSAYFHNIRFGFIPNVNIETGMRRILAGEYKLTHPRASEILEFGYYHKHIRNYRHFHERGRMLVLFHEDIIADRAAAIRSVYEYLGIDTRFVPPALSSRPHDGVFHPLRLGLLRLRNPFLFRYSPDGLRLFERKRNPVGHFIGRAIAALDKYVLASLLGNEKPDLSPELRASLFRLYKDDMARLQETLGRDLSPWRANSPKL